MANTPIGNPNRGNDGFDVYELETTGIGDSLNTGTGQMFVFYSEGTKLPANLQGMKRLEESAFTRKDFMAALGKASAPLEHSAQAVKKEEQVTDLLEAQAA